jgi:hypothetical protein
MDTKDSFPESTPPPNAFVVKYKGTQMITLKIILKLTFISLEWSISKHMENSKLFRH